MELSFRQMAAAYLVQILLRRYHLRHENPIRRWLNSSIPANDISCGSASAHSPPAEPVACCEYAGSLIGSVA